MCSKMHPMPMPSDLLDILCCPVSKRPLRRLDKQRLKRLNSAIGNGDVQYVDGTVVPAPLSDALVTDDGKVVYAIADGIPVLLPDLGIGTTQFNDW